MEKFDGEFCKLPLLSHAASVMMPFFRLPRVYLCTGEPTEKALVTAAYHAGANKTTWILPFKGSMKFPLIQQEN